MSVTVVAHHKTTVSLSLPLYLSFVSAGFPSPADEYMDKRLDLNEHLISRPEATFYCRVSGDSMRDAGIFDGDLLVVDRSINPKTGSIVIASVDGNLTCKILDVHRQMLLCANPDHNDIKISGDIQLIIEGVVIHLIRSFARSS